MKKATRKLALKSMTVRSLTGAALDRARGGNPEPVANGFIMKDTVIIRTGGIVPAPGEGR